MAERDGSDPTRPPAGEATTAVPHSGWARQPQANYDAGDSGGWGGPGHRDSTGPVPRLSRNRAPAAPTTAASATTSRTHHGRETATGGASSPTTGETAWVGHDTADTSQADEHLAEAHLTNEHEPLVVDTRHRDQQAGASKVELAASSDYTDATHASDLPRALLDPTFGLRTTRVLVPVTYIVVVLYLVLDYMRSIFNYSGAAGTTAGGFMGMLILLFVGLVKIVAVAFLARLLLELCLNVAEMRAGSGRGRRD